MAAEVPAKDVLREAVEYLSKLGSNLRARSETLKEKRIRKEKLNNVLAMQKAASKVLLICELSKKSLENVETGVRKVLELIDTSQAVSSDGGKRSNNKSNPEITSKYFFFEYKSRKLRIKKRISLKHYTSVRVRAKRISKSAMDSYPVHYDCKLYRMRQKECKTVKRREDGSESLMVNNAKESASPPKERNSDVLEKHHKNEKLIASIRHTSPTKSDISMDKNINTRKSLENEEHDKSHISIPTSPVLKSIVTDENVDKEKRRKPSREFSKERSLSKDNDQLKKQKVREHCDVKMRSEGEKIEPRKSFEADSSSNNKEETKKKYRKLKVIVDSSDDEKETTFDSEKEKAEESIESSKKNHSGEAFHEPQHKKRKLSDEGNGDKSSANANNEAANKELVDDTVNNCTKPIIKCVSLSKLLKPDILIDNEIAKPDSPPKYRSLSENKHKHPENKARKNRIADKLAEKQKLEEKYWVQKRSEVSSFKPKNVVINVIRLPEFSLEYLKKLSLRKITQGGVTILEIIDDLSAAAVPVKDNVEAATLQPQRTENKTKSAESNTNSRRASSNSNDDDLIAEANKVKNSLLNESDSDDNAIGSDNEKIVSAKETDNVKMALLNDSDLDEKKSDDEILSACESKTNKDFVTDQAQKAKNALCTESDSESDKIIPKSASSQAEKRKSSLDDSDSDLKIKKTHSKQSHSNRTSSKTLNLVFDTLTEKNKDTEDKIGKKSMTNESDSDNSSSKTNSPELLSSGSESGKTKSNKEDEVNKKSMTDGSDSDNSNSNTSFPKLVYSDLETRKNKTDTLNEKEGKSIADGSDSDSKTSSPKLMYSDSESGKNTGIEIEEQSVAAGPNIENADDNSREKKSKEVIEKNENLSECRRNERTPEKTSLTGDCIEIAKSSLLNDSPNDKIKTPLSQRMTPQSRKKCMKEGMHAKKMLLTYSSSDTEDEQLKEALKEIKDALLNVSDEEISSKNQEQEHFESSPSSDEDILKVKKKITYDSSSSKEKEVTHERKKHRRKKNNTKNGNSDNSKSSSSKMVRSKSKPGNSSQNSDAQDSSDKDIEGLTNMNTLNKSKTRRRNSNDTDETEESGTSKTKSHSTKPTGIISQEMLKSESSSDSASASGEENQLEDDDLPTVALPNFNGGAEHLVKEDLLGESDSSASQNEDADKNDDSDDEEKLNSRRRKANAIASSDSEAGSSRKKEAKESRLSDFEDSDDSDLTKRTKRKKKVADSDASVGSNSSNEGGKKKRRRIKSVRDSDVSGSESETEGRNKHGRKNIRKVMGKNQLEEATKKAAREEKERIARITERQKMYNNLEFDESGKPDEVVLDKVVLDFDPETKEPLIEVDRGLVKKLKPHQANGIKFMWDACFESAKRIKKDRGSGCILAHCMGLGKTLQVVSLTHTLLTHGDLTRVNRVLVVCPLSTVLNWVNEFRMWLKHAEREYEVDVYELSRYKQNSERAFQLSQWFQYGGVCVLGYEMFRNLSADNSKKFKKKMLKNFQEALVDPGPDLVVCDEGHLLKNEKTSLSQSMNRVKTHRRIVLTGTPLQNNLKEYYCMVQFVKPNLLGKYNEYLNRFVNPITNGQYTDSTEHDIKIMKRRSHVLHKMLDGAVQRRDYGVLAPFLPPKHEYVLFITLSEVQTKLYQHYLDNFSRRPQAGKSSGFLFPDFQSLQRIWTHPLVLKYNSERYEIMQQKKRDKEEEEEGSEGSLVDFIDDESTPDESSTEESSDDSSDLSDDSRKKSKKKKAAKKSKGKDKGEKGDIKMEGGQSRPRRGTRANPIEIDDDLKDVSLIEMKTDNPTEWWMKLVVDDELEDMRNSHKLVLLFDILRQCETIGDKLLVFSQSLYSLDLIEHFLGKVDEATQEGRIDEKLGGHVGSWSPGVDYFRLDGSTSCENRSIWCKNFNREDNPRARLFLISTRAGGLGINLVAANRVVIFDVSWNPSHDVQSIFRVYRFGQKKPCYVYRFLAMGTMEEKIYERQVTKQAISKRVIDEQQIDRHYAENDLAELYKFEPEPPSPRPIPPLPKDRLFAEMLREHEAQIYKYHEHDSLLENKEEETLSEEERKAAWEDFENEKNRPPPAPFPSPWPMHNGMVPGLLAQQQQQLAYAALAAMLRKDMPNLNDNQLRDMLPLIYNANPQLMQKMGEIYKYTQPGMMNPGLINPGVMNAAGGASALGGMGGASGLQYEPPWQRQQQQQQQMRLQQMMQQQNPMGAKFYAGGLGSRDPVAMALQQQRAREIMLGGAGRPRGRPPHAARAPTHTGDVVNIDSD